MNELQLASARLLARALERDASKVFLAAHLRRFLPAEVVTAIKDKTAEYRAFNKDLKNTASTLSGGADDYWKEAKKMLNAGRLALGAGGRAREKSISEMCERLEESFQQRVPSAERGMFLIYDERTGVWDDRWHACVDWFPPLLRQELADHQRIAEPKRQAQVEVLSSLSAPPLPVGEARSQEASARLRALARSD